MNYRKLYESYYGPIPKDQEGRAYDIHHIDGNHSNISHENLKAVTIQEHYDIHLSQNDWKACHAISLRMKTSPDVISRLATLSNLQRVADGTNPFLNKAASGQRARKRVADGTNPFLNPEIARKSNQERIDNGTHHFFGGKIQTENNQKRVANGTHNFVKPWKCEHCNKEGKGTTSYVRYHGDKCKALIRKLHKD